ncbi:uncharacterized protein BDZ99DRAFT_141889 [Mytilinidion resinicola]|uniref:Protein kinase domain-containing protein n=1 Tax=Mytilinidion resinicola TaxID=574789 RepID=A0A6A6Z6F9_9PEZI|nr:uncharacterized protein BDZ99DRAFT_141889 [Mytilinidion resinicola]KAF2816692.1 hypothetical protein BDZ99DRAFT_141889 [Mytilinidion resinicola]
MIDALWTMNYGECYKNLETERIKVKKEGDIPPDRRPKPSELFEGADDNWEHILHLDLKPANVFLADPFSDFRAYQVAQIGDFDLSYQVPLGQENEMEDWNTSPLNLRDRRFAGTKGWKAPVCHAKAPDLKVFC